MTDMSLDNIRITASNCKLDFKQARRLAEQVIRGMVRTPRLIAWRDTAKQSYADNESDNKKYLDHDSRIRVDINDDEYSFIFAESE